MEEIPLYINHNTHTISSHAKKATLEARAVV